MLKTCLKLHPLGGLSNLYRRIFSEAKEGSPDHLYLSTLHSAKGLEYDIVIMVGLEKQTNTLLQRFWRNTA